MDAPTLGVCYYLSEVVARPDREGHEANCDQDTQAGGTGPALQGCPDRLSYFSSQIFDLTHFLSLLNSIA